MAGNVPSLILKQLQAVPEIVFMSCFMKVKYPGEKASSSSYLSY